MHIPQFPHQFHWRGKMVHKVQLWETTTIQTQSSCSQTNDSSVKVIQGNSFLIFKLIQYQLLSYIFQHNFLW